jgi:hypothetical protein
LKDLVSKRIQFESVDSSTQNELLVDFLVRSSIGLLVTLIALFTFSAHNTDTAMNKTEEAVNPVTIASPGLAIAPVEKAERYNREWYETHTNQNPASPAAKASFTPTEAERFNSDWYQWYLNDDSRH